MGVSRLVDCGVVTESPLIAALGCAVRIDAAHLPDDEACEVARVWADAASQPTDPLPAWHRTVAVERRGSLADTLSAFSQKVTLEVIEARRGELWMLHAAAVADDWGRVVAVVGPSGRGKTTASRALSTAYGYVSDETVGIAPDGTVAPYRKPLSVIEQVGATKAQRSPSELGLGTLPTVPLRLSAIVVLDRRPDGPDAAVVEECDLGEVLSELVEQTSYLPDLDAPLRTIAAHAAATGGIRRVVYREAATLTAALAPLFTGPQAAPLPDPLGAAVRVDPEATGAFRGAFLDAIALDDPDRIAVLQPELPEGGTLRVIAGIAPVLWRAADGAGSARLVQAARDAHGDPDGGDADAVVAAAVDDLAAAGVLAAEPSWRIRADAAWTGEGNRFVALQLENLTNPTPVALEGSAAIIWRILSEGRGLTRTALTAAVAERAGVTPDEVRTDVEAFLLSLREAALIECVAP